ncbi:hypothetical protein SLS64_010714 [Diaporthe eres]|uniref:SAP domain-containing protein n=1 Tax=Diaporthe eres TaxID=83184 RepID=A0ABR1P7M3_DIAER
MADRPYFLRATVVGLRAQLEGLGLNSSGLKVDLYLRLMNGGHSLYTDDRDQSDDDQSDSDQSDSDQSDSDQPGDNDGDDGQGGDPPGGAGQKRPRNDGGGDDDDDNNGDDNQGSLRPPPRKTLRVGNAIPAELRLQIMGYLNFAQLWNLAMADPAGYLSDDINIFAMDAGRQHAIDYPPGDSNDGGSNNGGSNNGGLNNEGSNNEGLNNGGSNNGGSNNGGSNNGGLNNGGSKNEGSNNEGSNNEGSNNEGSNGGNGSGGSGNGDSGSGGSAGSPSSGGGDDNNDRDDDPNRPLSMLQWVGRRLIYDPAFGTAWRVRILQLIDTYLQVYGQADNAPEDGNVIEDMLYYLRPQPLYGAELPLVQAAHHHRPDVVHLLLLRGEPVDQTIPRTRCSALSEALDGLGVEVDATSSGRDGMYTIFALIGAGADVTWVTPGARGVAETTLQQLDDGIPWDEDSLDWPRIVNVRGLSVREFIADPRSDYFDRIRLAMYVIAFSRGDMEYPRFE